VEQAAEPTQACFVIGQVLLGRHFGCEAQPERPSEAMQAMLRRVAMDFMLDT